MYERLFEVVRFPKNNFNHTRRTLQFSFYCGRIDSDRVDRVCHEIRSFRLATFKSGRRRVAFVHST
jgi:hypothetical protein